MKKLLPALLVSLLLNSLTFSQGCPTNLFFSEYIEGSGNNKVLEIYNPLPYTVDLNDYVIERFTNGSPTVSATFALGESIGPGQTYVICNNLASAAILALKDTVSGVLNFNGDDVVILKHEFTFDTLDQIGIVGVDPGTNWPVGAGATSEFTLVRMSSVGIGTTDWALSATQWNVLPQDDITNLGTHTFSASSNVYNFLSASICDSDSLLFNGTYLFDAGSYNDTLAAVSGCDSIVTMTLTVNPTYLIQKDTSTCPGGSVFIGGANQTVAGFYYDNYTTTFGCDSIVEWNFTFYVEDFIQLNDTICAGDSIFLEGGWQLLDGVYTDVYTSVLTGCDSIVETTLAVYTVNTGVSVSGFTLTAVDASGTYQWLDCDNAMIEIFGAWLQDYSPSFDGNYAVEITNNGCVDTSACNAILGMGLENSEPALFDFHPNPATDFITVSASDANAEVISLVDMHGGTVSEYILNSASPQVIPVDFLAPGIYVIRVTTAAGTSQKVFVKK